MIICVEDFKIRIIKQEKVGISNTISTPTVESVRYATLEISDSDDTIKRIFVKGDLDDNFCSINCRSLEEVLFCIREIRIWALKNNIEEFKIINNGRIRLC